MKTSREYLVRVLITLKIIAYTLDCKFVSDKLIISMYCSVSIFFVYNFTSQLFVKRPMEITTGSTQEAKLASEAQNIFFYQRNLTAITTITPKSLTVSI